MNTFQGISASTGIATGTIFLLKKSSQKTIIKKAISKEQLNAGWDRFEKARNDTLDYFTSLIAASSNEEKKIFESYILMLSDPEFITLIKTSYQQSLICIEYILNQKVNEFANQLKMAKDKYLSERANDILDVYGKVLERLVGTVESSFDKIPQNSILVTEFLNPSDAILLSKYSIKGLVLHDGGKNSHLSILARTYQIPLVFDIKIDSSFKTGEYIIVDGNKSTVFVNPDKDLRDKYQIILTKEADRQKKLYSFINQRPHTKDNIFFSFLANIGSLDDAKQAAKNGADGIGLFRTEFLFMDQASKNSLIMTEEEQTNTYIKVLEIMKGKPVTIRTLDAGGDKIITAEGIPSDTEKNPLLGWRAIRFCLDRKDIFKTQLRALYRASVYGNLKIMIPLITHFEQLDQIKLIIDQVKTELLKESIPFNPDIPVGIMVETPAASCMSDVFSQHCDFFSIGTNDLTQYMLCVDRENSLLSNLFQEKNPAVLRQIQNTVDNAKKASIPVSVCGEMASSTDTLLLLLGMGVTTVSMAASKLCEAKEFISHFTYATMLDIAKKIENCTTTAEINTILEKCISENL